MKVIIRFKSPYFFLCSECQKWWIGTSELNPDTNPHIGHSVLMIKYEKEVSA